jgi:hypothetical protein
VRLPFWFIVNLWKGPRLGSRHCMDCRAAGTDRTAMPALPDAREIGPLRNGRTPIIRPPGGADAAESRREFPPGRPGAPSAEFRCRRPPRAVRLRGARCRAAGANSPRDCARRRWERWMPLVPGRLSAAGFPRRFSADLGSPPGMCSGAGFVQARICSPERRLGWRRAPGSRVSTGRAGSYAASQAERRR